MSDRMKIAVKACCEEQCVRYSGSNVDVISDTERNTFGLSDKALKDAVEKYHGRRPDDVFIKSPTPWGDLYYTEGWNQVRRTLRPKSARIIRVTSTPVIITTKEFINDSPVKAKYTSQINHQLQNTISSSWSKGGEISGGVAISYNISMGVASVDSSANLSYTSSWGENISKSQSVTIGSMTGVEIELDPHQSVSAILQANRGTMKVQVKYLATLDGDVVVHYKDEENAWGFDVNKVLEAADMPTTFRSWEVLKIGFYSDDKIITRGMDTYAS